MIQKLNYFTAETENHDVTAMYDLPGEVGLGADGIACEPKMVRIRQSHIKADIIDVFSDPSVIPGSPIFTVINNYGKAEEGVGSGVTKEVFSLFWKDAYESLMVGELENVPFIRHAIRRILVKGCRLLAFENEPHIHSSLPVWRKYPH